jgi:hypothetical protein
MMDDQLEKLYHKYWGMHSELMASGSNPIEIAGILTAHALIIYKTILSEDDFDSMVDSISDTRHKVKKLAPGETLQ